MSRLKKADYTLEDMCLIITVLLISTDREGLTQPERVEALQQSILPVGDDFNYHSSNKLYYLVSHHNSLPHVTTQFSNLNDVTTIVPYHTFKGTGVHTQKESP